MYGHGLVVMAFFVLILKEEGWFMSNILEEIDITETDTQHGRYLTFLLGNDIYGIEIERVIEIVGMQKISSLPESHDYEKGVVNLRGMVIPVVDMRLRLKMEEQ